MFHVYMKLSLVYMYLVVEFPCFGVILLDSTLHLPHSPPYSRLASQFRVFSFIQLLVLYCTGLPPGSSEIFKRLLMALFSRYPEFDLESTQVKKLCTTTLQTLCNSTYKATRKGKTRRSKWHHPLKYNKPEGKYTTHLPRLLHLYHHLQYRRFHTLHTRFSHFPW